MKRGWSREFSTDTSRRVAISIDRVPPAMKRSVMAKAKREGVSVRALVLGWFRNWLDGRRPDDDGTATEPKREG